MFSKPSNKSGSKMFFCQNNLLVPKFYWSHPVGIPFSISKKALSWGVFSLRGYHKWLANLPPLTYRNKGLMAGLIQGNQWLISPDHNRFLGGDTLGGVGWLAMMERHPTVAQTWRPRQSTAEPKMRKKAWWFYFCTTFCPWIHWKEWFGVLPCNIM